MKRRTFVGTIAAGLTVGSVTKLQASPEIKATVLIYLEGHPTMLQVSNIAQQFKELCGDAVNVMILNVNPAVVGQQSTFYSVRNGCKGIVRDGSGVEVEKVAWVETSAGLVGVMNTKTHTVDVYHVPGVTFEPSGV